MNQGLMTALTAVGTAQLLKGPLQLWRNKEARPRTLFGAGGMPSAHSSGVAALASYMAVRRGIRSPEFAIAAMLGIIVMYDAMNLRRHAGEMAIQVNDLDAHVEALAGHHPGIHHTRRKQELEERIGHQPVEVLGGALLGTALGTASALLIRP
ncbi:divergent PAP2 family protein [Xylanibacillus composti]|uniref:Membrane protein n=1 Tax=Xylanibacillus composti TaxID=1572762 RepID=A0A8J4M4G0_9BACL|nr:divergent PAP2 family protein [Xylanibacillus composti]MDT9724004.1 divergent PAP2 family protein [Xylanibacillus composti]GIQ71090.1 membrane protein [Xylanibacillus composti]